MYYRFIGLFVLALFSVGAFSARAQMLEYIVALVDNDVILSSEFEQFRKIQRFEEQGVTRSDTDILDSLILRRIQINRAKQRGISVGDGTINERLIELAAQNNLSTTVFLQRLDSFPGGIRGYRNYLYDNLLLEQFQRIELQSQIGVSEEDARRFLVTEVGQSISRLLYQVAFVALPIMEITDRSEGRNTLRDTSISEQVEQMVLFLEGEGDFAQLTNEISAQYTSTQVRELPPSRLAKLPSIFSRHIPLMRVGSVVAVEREDKVYLVKLLGVSSEEPVFRAEVRTRHILLQPTILRSREQTFTELQSLRGRILSGEAFATLAKVYSDDPGSASGGGELGWLPYAQLDASFADAARNLEIGQLSQPVESSFGFHLIEVLERANRDISEFTELNRIRQHIFEQKLADELPRMLTGLRQNAFIEVRRLPASPE